MSRPPSQTGARTARRSADVSLTLPEARALLRLCNELHDAPPDPAARKARLLEGLCGLLRADAGVSVVTHAGTPGGATTVVTLARYGMAEADAKAFAAEYRSTATATKPPSADPGRRARDHPGGGTIMTENCVESAVLGAGVKLRACLIVVPAAARAAIFPARVGGARAVPP